VLLLEKFQNSLLKTRTQTGSTMRQQMKHIQLCGASTATFASRCGRPLEVLRRANQEQSEVLFEVHYIALHRHCLHRSAYRWRALSRFPKHYPMAQW